MPKIMDAQDQLSGRFEDTKRAACLAGMSRDGAELAGTEVKQPVLRGVWISGALVPFQAQWSPAKQDPPTFP